MSLRSIATILTALAMLFAPFVMQSGAAMAMAPADHRAQMMESGHCGDQPAKSHDGKAMDKPCCAAMCAPVAIVPPAKPQRHALKAAVEGPAADRFHQSFLAELPTPPPRLA
jgi:hypothetical protein